MRRQPWRFPALDLALQHVFLQGTLFGLASKENQKEDEQKWQPPAFENENIKISQEFQVQWAQARSVIFRGGAQRHRQHHQRPRGHPSAQRLGPSTEDNFWAANMSRGCGSRAGNMLEDAGRMMLEDAGRCWKKLEEVDRVLCMSG